MSVSRRRFAPAPFHAGFTLGLLIGCAPSQQGPTAKPSATTVTTAAAADTVTPQPIAATAPNRKPATPNPSASSPLMPSATPSKVNMAASGENASPPIALQDHCSSPKAKLLLPGVDRPVVNNATTLEDAEDDDTPFSYTKGIITQTQSLLATIRNESERLGCCYDKASHPVGDDGLDIMLRFEFDSSMTLTSVKADPQRSKRFDASVATCLERVTKTFRYVAAKPLKATVFELPIRLKAIAASTAEKPAGSASPVTSSDAQAPKRK